MEAMQQSRVAEQLNIIWRPHPVLPAANAQFKTQPWKPGQSVREILIANGIDQYQPISIILDDRLLTVAEWDSVCPHHGQVINVKAEVAGGGGGGGSNALMIVAQIALVIVAVALAAPTGGASLWLAGATGLSAATAGALIGAGIMIAGSLLINAVFASQTPALDMNSMGGTSSTSPTYSLSGGSNRARLYESIPVIMGNHRFLPDAASRPYTEYDGADQYLYQIFHNGLNRADLSQWKIGTNDIENYKDYEWSYVNSEGKITAFPGNVDSTQGSELTFAEGWVVRTTSPNTYQFAVDVEGVLFTANNDGSLGSTTVRIDIEYRPVGTSTWLQPSQIVAKGSRGFVTGSIVTYTEATYPNAYWDEEGNYYQGTAVNVTKTKWVSGEGNIVRITGSSQKTRRATLTVVPASVGQFEVRIKRQTADSTDSKVQNKTYWSVLKSYQQDNADYTNQYRVGLTIRANEQLNGTVQQLSAYAESYAHYYNGSSWVTAKTSNPAHWFMHFAKGVQNAAGKTLFGVGLSNSQIDLDSLVAWASFCNTEGLTFNAVLDGSQTAADILSGIAKCGFASPTWASGKLGVVWDARNQSPVAAFGMSNIIKNSFEIRYITEQLADEIVVRYINPDKDWQQDEVRVVVQGVDNPVRTTTVDVFGCTNTAMAGKFANYLAAQQYYRRRRITWDCDFEGFVCQRGDVVLLSHDLTQWGYSGRIVAVDGNTVTIDRKVPRNGANEYLMIKQPDGTMTTYVVSAESGDDNTLTLTSTPTLQEGYELMDHVWFFSPLATPGKKVKIISIQPISETRIQIIATDEDPAFYAAWDGSWIEPQQSSLLLNNTPVVSNVRCNEMLYVGTDSVIKSRVSVIWDVRGAWERANVSYKIGDDPWTTFTTTSTSFEFDTDKIGEFDVKIVPIYSLLTGLPVESEFYLYGIEAAVADVTGLINFFRQGRTVIKWDLLSDPRFIEYEIRKGTNYESAQILGKVVTNEFTTDGDGTYWVTAYAGTISSETPASILIEGSTLVENVVASWDEEATGWLGTRTGGAIIDGSNITLSGSPVSTTGSYEIPASHIIDVGTSQACNVSVTYRMYAENPNDLFSAIPVFSQIPSLIGVYAGQADVKIQIAIATDSGVFGDWRDFVPGTYVGRKFKIRANLYSYNEQIRPVLDTLTFTVDMPDRIDRGTNVSATAGGISITYVKPFQIVPNVQVTVVNALANDDIVLSNETEEGFDVKIINGTSDVTRTINWLAQGY